MNRILCKLMNMRNRNQIFVLALMMLAFSTASIRPVWAQQDTLVRTNARVPSLPANSESGQTGEALTAPIYPAQMAPSQAPQATSTQPTDTSRIDTTPRVQLPRVEPGPLLTPQQLNSEPWYTDLREALKQPARVYKLVLAKKKLKQVPLEVLALRNLQVLHMNNNRLKTLPKEIVSLTNLQELNLFRNGINELPSEIAGLHNLQTLLLGQNKLVTFPYEIVGLRKLRLLDVTQNPLTLHEIAFVVKRLPACTVRVD
jgi:Leucine-rich repeat (LRR) protein